MNQSLCYVFVVAVLVGCQSATTSEADGKLAEAQEIYTETMTLHDEVMPRMDEVMQLRQKLQLRVDALREEDEIEYADSLQKMEQAVQNLQEADRAMMQWMRTIKKVPGTEEPLPTSPDEEMIVDTVDLIQQQRQQLADMKQVKEQMENSIEEAQRMIGLPE